MYICFIIYGDFSFPLQMDDYIDGHTHTHTSHSSYGSLLLGHSCHHRVTASTASLERISGETNQPANKMRENERERIKNEILITILLNVIHFHIPHLHQNSQF